jgi:hypothetical protein
MNLSPHRTVFERDIVSSRPVSAFTLRRSRPSWKVQRGRSPQAPIGTAHENFPTANLPATHGVL